MEKPTIFVFRWVFVVAGGFFFVVGILGAPERGRPPLASLLDRQTLSVVSAELGPVEFVGGNARWRPRVKVRWPDDPDGARLVEGVDTIVDRGDHLAARAFVLDHAPGTGMRVRIAEDRPWVDHTDVFALMWTIFAGVLGAIVFLIGVVINRVLAP